MYLGGSLSCHGQTWCSSIQSLIRESLNSGHFFQNDGVTETPSTSTSPAFPGSTMSRPSRSSLSRHGRNRSRSARPPSTLNPNLPLPLCQPENSSSVRDGATRGESNESGQRYLSRFSENVCSPNAFDYRSIGKRRPVDADSWLRGGIPTREAVSTGDTVRQSPKVEIG